jgi:hypothetical protein
VLKGQLVAGRITQAQFDAALKQQMLQDAQGRYWTLGAESGKWYLHDGQTWVEAQPPGASRSNAPATVAVGQPPARKSIMVPIIAIGMVAVICVLGTVIVWFALNQGIIKISQTSPTNPPISTQVINPTAVPTSSPTVRLSTDTPVPTAPLLPTLQSAIGTPLPTVPPQPNISTTTNTPVPTVPPQPSPPTLTPQPTKAPTFTAIPPSPTPAIPPGLYVTLVRLEPSAPGLNQEVGFYVTFLNSASGTQNYRWNIYIYKADNLRNSFGELSAQLTSIPVGTTEQKALGVWKTGASGCGNYIARPAWLDENKKATPFVKPDGQMYELPFTVCQ